MVGSQQFGTSSWVAGHPVCQQPPVLDWLSLRVGLSVNKVYRNSRPTPWWAWLTVLSSLDPVVARLLGLLTYCSIRKPSDGNDLDLHLFLSFPRLLSSWLLPFGRARAQNAAATSDRLLDAATMAQHILRLPPDNPRTGSDILFLQRSIISTNLARTQDPLHHQTSSSLRRHHGRPQRQ